MSPERSRLRALICPRCGSERPRSRFRGLATRSLRTAATCSALVAAMTSCSGGSHGGTIAGSTASTNGRPTVALAALSRNVPAVESVHIPKRARAVCRKLSLIAPLCPSRVPRAPYASAQRAPGFSGPTGSGATAVCLSDRLRGVSVSGRACRIQIFALEAGAPKGPRPRAARPPHYIHIVVYATRGRLGRSRFSVLPFAWPRTLSPTSAAVVGRTAGDPLLLAANANATVVLAPPFPNGGEMGGHLIVRWQRQGVDYAVSIHAWSPLPAGRFDT
jgi:hypothetical protein